MKFEIAELLKSPCPNLWHSLVGIGQVINGQLEVPAALARPLLAACQDPPISLPSSAASEFAARLRTEQEKAPLRQICSACEFAIQYRCEGSTCSGNRVPIEVRLNLTSSQCPEGKWPNEPLKAPLSPP